ncbi:hypothetical protein [Rickettsia endosymbiont of Ixodes pacificus]|uniref:hypothetical protein n=1 Tax=Rickettsia endosymbiont of Ixodes pacificus TaxID=1133329 RepID=UPI0012E04110|nr:hypothetical protein [Rickettsia endosymbiont of Ixodes pacificus]
MRGYMKPSLQGGIVVWTGKTHCVIPWSSHGMTKVKLIHATMLCEERSDTAIQKNNKKML